MFSFPLFILPALCLLLEVIFLRFIQKLSTDLDSIVKVVRENTDTPCAIGFGISTPEQCAKMGAIADGAIVGSAIVKLVAQYGKDAAGPVGEYVRSMKEALE